MSDNEFKEVSNMEELEKSLKEMREAWADICEAFGVDPEMRLQPEVLKNNLRATLIDLNELQNLDYVKKSGKPLEKLDETYMRCLIKCAFLHVEKDDSQVWQEEVERYLKEIVTDEVLAGTNVTVTNDENVTAEQLLSDVQRVFSIANQLNIIRGMESGNVSPEMFMSLEDNFIYLNIGIVQTCNGNAVIMGKAVSFIKTLIKINDNILKSISQMLSR